MKHFWNNGKRCYINVLLLLLSLLSVPYLKGNYKSGDKYEKTQTINKMKHTKGKQTKTAKSFGHISNNQFCRVTDVLLIKRRGRGKGSTIENWI